MSCYDLHVTKRSPCDIGQSLSFLRVDCELIWRWSTCHYKNHTRLVRWPKHRKYHRVTWQWLWDGSKMTSMSSQGHHKTRKSCNSRKKNFWNVGVMLGQLQDVSEKSCDYGRSLAGTQRLLHESQEKHDVQSWHRAYRSFLTSTLKDTVESCSIDCHNVSVIVEVNQSPGLIWLFVLHEHLFSVMYCQSGQS